MTCNRFRLRQPAATRAVVLPALAMLMALPAAFARDDDVAPLPKTPLVVVATHPALASIAAQVGGDEVQVTSITTPAGDVHAVEAKPSVFAMLRDADALVHSGLDLELWANDAIDGSRNARLRAGRNGNVDCSTGISLLEVPDSPSRTDGDVHVFGNPHYWTDPLNGKIIASTIAAHLALLRPTAAATFEANRDAFSKDIDRHLRVWLKAAIKVKNTPLVTYHNSFPYFMRRFGFRVVGTVEPKPRIAPTQAHLVELIDTIKAEGVKVVIREPFQDASATRFLAEKTGVTVLTLSTLPGVTDPKQTYQELIGANLDAIVGALR